MATTDVTIGGQTVSAALPPIPNYAGIGTAVPGSSYLSASTFSRALSAGGGIGGALNALDSVAQGIISGNPISANQGLSTSAGQAASSASSSFMEFVSQYFLRAVVIILGFIFVTVGLGMFKNAGTQEIIVNNTARHIKKTVTGKRG